MRSEMRHRTLGRTGLRVSEVGLGGLFVSRVGGDRAQAAAAVRRALELGVNWVDTAPSYADSEEVLGRALHERLSAKRLPIVFHLTTLAQKFCQAGLLSKGGMEAVLR